MKENSFDIAPLFDVYAPLLTEKQQDFFRFYHHEDLSLSEIAENTGITRQGVRDAVARAEALLYEFEEKLGFCEKFEKLSSALSKIKPEADAIVFVNERRGQNYEIRDCANRIIALCEDVK